MQIYVRSDWKTFLSLYVSHQIHNNHFSGQGNVLPRGIMERYLPRNLLATVISCLKVQPLREIT